MYKDRSQRAKRAVVTRSNTTVNRLPSVCILYWEQSFSCLQKEIGRPAMCKEDNLTEFLSMKRERERDRESSVYPSPKMGEGYSAGTSKVLHNSYVSNTSY